MKSFEVSVSETIVVPDDCEIKFSPTGTVAGLVLPNGTMIKPWIVFERYDSPEGDALGDMDTLELCAMGIDVGLEFERDITPSTLHHTLSDHIGA